MLHPRQTIVTLTVFLSAAALTACLGLGEPVEPLEGTEWVLTMLNGDPLVEGSRITLNFTGDKADGFAGCNRYGGEYTATDASGLQFPEFAITAMLCLSPEGVMQQEETFKEALGSAVAYHIVDDRLEIENASGETILVFAKKAEFPMNPGDLVGTEWQLVSLNGRPPVEGSIARGEVLTYAPLPPGADTSPEGTIWTFTAFVEGETTSPRLTGTEITLTFEGGTLNQRGAVSGSAGCNAYSTAYVFDGSFLAFEAPVMTEQYCSNPPGIMEQEQRYLGFLKDVTVYRIDDNQLSLETGEGRALVFTVQN